MNLKLIVSYKPITIFTLFDHVYLNNRKVSQPVNNIPQVAHYFQKFDRPIKLQIGEIYFVHKSEV